MLDYREWEKMFWRDRSLIRQNPAHRFRHRIGAAQLYFLDPRNKIDSLCRLLPSYPDLKASAYRSGTFLSVLFNLMNHATRGIPPAIARGLSSKLVLRLLKTIGEIADRPDTRFEDSLTPLLRRLPVEIRKVVSETVRGIIASRQNPFCWCVSHTEINRQQDGNLYLQSLPFFSRKPLRVRQALFGGGSTGLTAAVFHNTLRTRIRPHWRVYNSDLYSPKDIWEQNQHTHVNQNAPFIPPPGISYLQADLRCLPFAPGTFDFLDACNCFWMETLNEQLDAVCDAWKLLEVGGYFRTVMGQWSSLFEEIIVRKTGSALSDWELVYLNIVGKAVSKATGDLGDPRKALAVGKILTRMVQALYGRLRQRDFRALSRREPDWTDPVACLLSDLCHLSPITLGASIPDDLWSWFTRNYAWFRDTRGGGNVEDGNVEEWAREHADIRRVLFSILEEASARLG